MFKLRVCNFISAEKSWSSDWMWVKVRGERCLILSHIAYFSSDCGFLFNYRFSLQVKDKRQRKENVFTQKGYFKVLHKHLNWKKKQELPHMGGFKSIMKNVNPNLNVIPKTYESEKNTFHGHFLQCSCTGFHRTPFFYQYCEFLQT